MNLFTIDVNLRTENNTEIVKVDFYIFKWKAKTKEQKFLKALIN